MRVINLKKHFLDKIEENIKNFFRRFVMGYFSIIYILVLLIIAICIYLNRHNQTDVSSLVQILVGLLAISVAILQLAFTRQNDLKSKITWRNYTEFCDAYKKLNILKQKSSNDLDHSVKKISDNKGMMFHSFNINDEKNQYIYDYIEKIENSIKEIQEQTSTVFISTKISLSEKMIEEKGLNTLNDALQSGVVDMWKYLRDLKTELKTLGKIQQQKNKTTEAYKKKSDDAFKEIMKSCKSIASEYAKVSDNMTSLNQKSFDIIMDIKKSEKF